jgi:Cupin-like domain
VFDDVKSTFEVPRVERPSRQEFEERFLFPQRPVIISGAMEGWPALERWTNDYLTEKVGARTVHPKKHKAHARFGPRGVLDPKNGQMDTPPMNLAEYIDLLDGATISDGLLYIALLPLRPACPSSGPMSVFPPSLTRTSSSTPGSGWAPATTSPLSITTPTTTSSRSSAAESR